MNFVHDFTPHYLTCVGKNTDERDSLLFIVFHVCHSHRVKSDNHRLLASLNARFYLPVT